MSIHSDRPGFARDGSLLPEGWAEVALEEIVVHALGGLWGEDMEAPGLVPVSVIRGKDYRDWSSEKGSRAAKRWIPPGSLEKRRLRAGDIVVEISGGGPRQPVGRTLLVDDEALRRAEHPLICSNFCRQIRLHPGVDPAFVQLALLDKYFQGEVEEFQTQTTNLRNLKFKEYLAGTLLRLPPRAEQASIVARIEEYIFWIGVVQERLSRVQPVLRKLRRSILAAACSGRMTADWRSQRTDLAPLLRSLANGPSHTPEPLVAPEVPDGWALVSLEDVIESHRYGTSERCEKNVEDGMPVLRMGNIQDGRIDYADLKMIDRNTKDIEKYELRRGDILFNRTNSAELVGKSAVFEGEREAIFASYLVRLRCNPGLVESRYVCAWINSPWGRQWARMVRTDCVNQSNINAKKLMTMPFPAPPLAEQQEIVRRMAALFRVADAIEKSFQRASARVEGLWRAILEQACRGDLIPLEADLAVMEGRDYESAQAFVERLRKENGTASRVGRPRLEALPKETPSTCPLSYPVDTGWVRPEDRSPEEILAAFRQVCWGAQPMSEEELLRRVLLRLGGSDLKPELRARLEAQMRIALERRILGRKENLFVGATPKFARYDDDFLLDVLRTFLPGEAERDRGFLTRAVAAWLGFSQVTGAMRGRMEEVFDEGIRRGVLDQRNGRICSRLP